MRHGNLGDSMSILKSLLVWLLLLATPCWGGGTYNFQLNDGQNPNYHYLGQSGSILDGATVLSGGGVVGSDGWPASINKPQHWWDFANNYNDGAGTNPINLTAGGSGNSFVPDWEGDLYQVLGLTGSGYAWSEDAFLKNLGATFSVICEFKTGADVTTAQCVAGVYNSGTLGADYGAWMISLASGTVNFRTRTNAAITVSNSLAVAANTWYQLIFTLDGNGNGILYLNNASVSTASMLTPVNSSLQFRVGCRSTDTQPFTGSVSRLGILVGTAWSSNQVAAIYNAWVTTDTAGIYARWYAATPGTVTKSINGTTSTVSSDTWGAEAAGKYGYAACALRYHAATTDLPGNPGGWPQ